MVIFIVNPFQPFATLARELPSLHHMTAEYLQFHHKKSTLGYYKSGNGKEPLLLFHGFGQSHTAFMPLIKSLGTTYTLYSFDLFFHGQSHWALDEKPLEKEYWADLLNQFLKENEIDNFSLLGFSLGGKFVLASLEAFPNRIHHVFLLAPDGIKTNAWYSLATYPIALRALFKRMIKRPGIFLAIVKMAKALRLVDKGILKFAQSQMESETERSRVYYSWVVFRHLKFNLNKLASLINSNQVRCLILIGQFDKIITEENMKSFLSKTANSKLLILPAGHNGLIKESVKVLGKYGVEKDINSQQS